MQKSWKNNSFTVNSFFVWRILIFLASVASIIYLPRFSDNFFGGKLINYQTKPLLWGLANFDGEHYLSIAFFGYKDLQQAFFPAYPVLIRIFSVLFGKSLFSYLISGIFISNLLFFASLFLFWKVARLDFSKKITDYAILALLVFPTSYYFANVYTESLFLFLSLLTYYLYRKSKYFLSGVVGVLMTLTRIYGLFVILMIGFEILSELLRKKITLEKIFREKIYLVFVSLLGLLGYMWYLNVNYADPFAFYNLQTLVGEQHQRGVVLLPQVFYRYFRILFSSQLTFYPLFTTLIEIVTSLLFVFIPIYGYIKKIRFSYILYILLGFLVPSAQGSFSSVPRYLLVIFPAFIIMGVVLEKLPKFVRVIFLALSAATMLLACALYFRGYFVA